MSGALRPPPYRPRPKEGEPDREEKLTESQLAARDQILRAVLVVTAVSAYSGFVFLLREFLPGGDYPWPFSMVPSFLLWPVSIVFAIVWSTDRKKLRTLVLGLTLLAAASVLFSLLIYSQSSEQWISDFARKFGG